MTSRRGPFEDLLEAQNRDRPEAARARHDGTIPFGPSMHVERFALGNGLKVLLLEDHAAPVVSMQTWLGVGSRHEKPGKTGLAHLFEHLMFGETEEHAYGVFDRLLEEAGAETNAATYLDWTYYHVNLPKDALDLALSLEAGRLHKLVLRDPQVAREKGVVANERRQRVEDDVDGSVSELLYREAFREHGYGWPTIGWMADIQGFTTDDCTGFYRTYYAPNNVCLVLSGDIDPGAALAKVQDTFGKLEASELPVEDVRPEPPQTAERRLRVDKPTPTHKVAIGYHAPGFGDFDHAPLVVLNEILFSGRASRVHRSLVQKLEIASEVRGYVGALRDPGLYDIWLSARPGKACEDLLTAFDAIVDELRRAPPPEAEIARAKAKLELGTLQGLETAHGKAEQIGFYETVLGDPGALFSKLDAYRRVGPGDLLRVARRYLTKGARTVVEVIPDPSMIEGDEREDEEGDEGGEEASSPRAEAG